MVLKTPDAIRSHASYLRRSEVKEEASFFEEARELVGRNDLRCFEGDGNRIGIIMKTLTAS